MKRVEQGSVSLAPTPTRAFDNSNASQEESHENHLSNRLRGRSAHFFVTSHTTGLATCDSGPRETWQPQAKLEKILVEKGWRVNRVKEDGGCYEVYAINDKGERVEAYFHPKTLESVPTQPRR